MLNEVYSSVQAEMLTKLASSRTAIKHSIEMDTALEDDRLAWFKEYLPLRYQADGAFVVDSEDNISEQIDIVIYDAQYSHLVFRHQGTRYVPIESVYAIFEVKQELSKEYLEYAGGKAESVRRLKRTSVPIVHAGGTYDAKPPFFIPAGILTLASTWKEPLGATFKKNLLELTTDSALQLGCVIKNGAFSVSNGEVQISSDDKSLVSFSSTCLFDCSHWVLFR